MGTTQDYLVAVEEGATIVRIGTRLYHRRTPACTVRRATLTSICRESGSPGEHAPRPMAFRDSWHSALVYFGLAEEYHDDYEDERGPRGGDRGPLPRAAQRRAACAAAATSTTTSSPRTTTDVARRRRGRARSLGDRAASRSAAAATATCACTWSCPKSFNDAQQIADKFKDSIPVILNLQGSDTDLSKRLIDFASGLTYALDGGMQRIADKVFMLTPRNVEISAEERARLIEKGFFNQS